eukprot:gene21562-28555_t
MAIHATVASGVMRMSSAQSSLVRISSDVNEILQWIRTYSQQDHVPVPGEAIHRVPGLDSASPTDAPPSTHPQPDGCRHLPPHVLQSGSIGGTGACTSTLTQVCSSTQHGYGMGSNVTGVGFASPPPWTSSSDHHGCGMGSNVTGVGFASPPPWASSSARPVEPPCLGAIAQQVVQVGPGPVAEASERQPQEVEGSFGTDSPANGRNSSIEDVKAPEHQEDRGPVDPAPAPAFTKCGLAAAKQSVVQLVSGSSAPVIPNSPPTSPPPTLPFTSASSNKSRPAAAEQSVVRPASGSSAPDTPGPDDGDALSSPGSGSEQDVGVMRFLYNPMMARKRRMDSTGLELPATINALNSISHIKKPKGTCVAFKVRGRRFDVGAFVRFDLSKPIDAAEMAVNVVLIVDIYFNYRTSFLGITAAISLHWAACFFYFAASINNFEEDTWVYQAFTDTPGSESVEGTNYAKRYTYAFYWALTTMSTVGYGDIYGISIYEKVFAMLTMIYAPNLSSTGDTLWETGTALY